MNTEKLEALKRDGWAEFFGMPQPVCPHCGTSQDVVNNEWWQLYEEGEHDVTCHDCANDFMVSTRVRYSFDRQKEAA